ncbi:carboxymuconolactone decarboxylase family protein [Acidicapsa ligni]|uniref:carboxymuconolactone decarboxylase family protein n=1 Tax=Acidicapsa ligni TaxID=542300 RepID=UPI0021E04E4A|nr:carboxymuconolactone decarboxylase family protein [Acidicapsa ligni]
MNQQITLFTPLGVETAPEKSRPILENIQKSFKFIPNLFGVFANSPVLLEGYVGLEKTFDKGSLSAVERQIILLSASVENSCGYCMAAHSTLLKAFMHVPAEVVSAVRANQPVSDLKLEALVALTKVIVRERGHVRAEVMDNFLAAGYRKDQVLEVLIGVALKTMSNYLDHISPTELDPAFQSEA